MDRPTPDLLAALRPEAVFDTAPFAVVATDLNGSIFYWNAAAERLFGYPKERFLGANIAELLVPSQGQAAGVEILATALAGHTWSGTFDVPRADGSTITVTLTDFPLREHGQVVGAIGIAHAAEPVSGNPPGGALAARLAALATITAELAAARDVAAVCHVVTTHAADAVAADTASVALLAENGQLELAGLRGAHEDDVRRRWLSFSIDDANPVSEAVRLGTPVTVIGRAELTRRYPGLFSLDQRDRSLVALPLRVGEHRLGAIGLSWERPYDLDDLDRVFLTTLADTCAQSLERLAAIAAAEDRTAKLAFLANASVELAGSLDYEATLRKVAKLAVPRLADWCGIEVVEDGQLRSVAAAHADPAKVALAERLRERYPTPSDAPTGAPAVVRTGVPELYPHIAEDVLAAGAHDDEHLRLLRELDLRSGIVVPLPVRGRVLGALTLITAESGRTYGPDDLDFAMHLARRAAVAIDNAHLHTETREAAVRLQRAVLPEPFGDMSPWQVGVHYRPAGRTDVGGDFYDAVRLADGRLIAVVGDVMGRGVTAAAAMAQVRAALRAYIAVNPDPASVVERLASFFTAYHVNQLVTLVYAAVDPAAGELRIACAGHIAPLIIRAAGGVVPATVTPSPPLGAGDYPAVVTVEPFSPGDVLLAFTDGLVERRGEDIDDGLARLQRAARLLRADASDRALADLADTMRSSGHDDDVTLLAVRVAE